MKDNKKNRSLHLECLEQRRQLSASMGWDGIGLGSADLTYYIAEVPDETGLSEAEVRGALEIAFNAWSNVADVTFTETDTPGQDGSIDISFGGIDGEGDTLAFSYLPDDVNSEPIAGDIVFDVDETWEIGNVQGDEAYDLVLVAAHEVGHTLGLEHSSVSGAVMFDGLSTDQVFAGLNTADMGAILGLYAPTTTIDSTTVTLDKAELADGDLITLTGIVDTPSDTDPFTVLVFWGDGSEIETVVLQPGTATFSVSHLYATDSSDPTESTYVLFHSFMDDETDSDTTYLVATVVRYDQTVADLGTVDQTVVDDLSLSNEAAYYEFVTAHDGVVTLETLTADAGDDVTIGLYSQDPVVNSSLVPLVVSTSSDEGQRIDYSVTAGQTFYVKIEGTNTDFDLRITNLVYQDGEAITVYGTALDDEFAFSAADGRQLTIGGVLYELPEDDDLAVTFNGGSGYDTVTLNDSPGDDSLEAWATEAVLSNSPTDGIADFTVSVGEFEELHVYARSDGNDTAVSYDSEGNDKFKAEPAESYAKMYGSSMYNRVKFFDVVEAYSSGGSDLARVFDTAGDDTFEGQKDDSRLQGDGYEVGVHGFAQVVAYASEGMDTALFVDSWMKDEFHAKSTKAELFDAVSDGEVYRITARRFDSVSAEATNSEGDDESGGQDIAKIWPTASDDYFEASDDWFRLYEQDEQLELLYEVVAFETVRVRETTDENDSGEIAEPLDYDLIVDEGWE